MFDNFRRFGRICSVISVGSVRFGSVTGFIHSLIFDQRETSRTNFLKINKNLSNGSFIFLNIETYLHKLTCVEVRIGSKL